ncbi:hypothetical protein [Marinobacter sp. X15-166B]|uniref:hypothetical protein n=1 Tax=Marinobacter sp. X15-166B TaxID=1897620 RepID=UPI00114D1551|nr:hypothetical protein [Marinobacter sp. X15-166B]
MLPASMDQPVPAGEPPTTLTPADNRVIPDTADASDPGTLGHRPMPPPTPATAETTQQREATGALQIPDWLAAIQSELGNRWRERNQRAQSEPVVNVTIGRVEVRAIQDKADKPAQARHRPSGVMTLEAYLQQRDRRGPA